MSNKEIAQALFVTIKTVEVHLSHAYRKLEIGSRAQLERVDCVPAHSMSVASSDSTLGQGIGQRKRKRLRGWCLVHHHFELTAQLSG